MQGQQPEKNQREREMDIAPVMAVEPQQEFGCVGIFSGWDDEGEQQSDDGDGAKIEEQQRADQALPIVSLYDRSPPSNMRF